MKTLLQRLAPFCLCAAALTLTATSALAGNGSLFTTNSGLFEAPTRAAAHVGHASRPKPLLYTGADPVKVENPVLEENPDAHLFLASSAKTARGRFDERDLNCLAEAIYHEARGESRQGQAAVAEVILNRVDSRKFPSSVCGVVNQPSQFSYTIGGRKAIGNKAAYLRARDIARRALSGAPRVLTGGATYFHTPAVSPSWSRRFQRTVQIGRHIFYRPGGRQVASN
ncbi:cell wall hydrolase [Paracoccus benzoatiresistens]|uniref:Cell wall hydrolase n=1 Tax=Paracoccus benzoatiresistens TaxID=2997341 RepID=A0ABT4J712_9RHOB|nr:cell wall hydrolase [Paracoccus sp. EF6]MCZ0962153.1 cell wall hydrolase [Paracoccus sp. EF6]